MIIGIFIKGYKTYQNLTFIPLLRTPQQKLSIFIGKNGSGKSSIQEALDTLFNDRQWNQNIHSKKGEGFVCPVFLLPKRERLQGKAADLISEHFWSYQIPENTGAANYEAWEEFIAFREELKSKIIQNDFNLIIIGKDEEGGLSYTKTHEKLKNSLKPKGISYNDHEKTLRSILERYRYIYLPIHNSPTSLVELKAKELQALLDKSLVKEIEKAFNRDEDGSGPIKTINTHLDKFIEEINTKLSTTEENCYYSQSQNHKITTEDIVDVVINKYFSKRPLQKDGKAIENLSSGEQRIAIIDVAHAFLSKSTNTNKELIISIDEPEASLSPVNCLKQFNKIFQISNKYGKQAIVSTHWYGLLMTPTPATLNHISSENDKPQIKSLDLSKIQEERRRFPDSFEMKSYFDLVSSMLSVSKETNQNWIICEGQDDKIYIQKYLGEKISNLSILPIGGKGGVRKAYEYLRIAIEDKAERGHVKGKILCIMDSDPEIITPTPAHKNSKNILRFLRFQITKFGEADLVEASDISHYKETELEDSLNAIDYYNAARVFIRRKAPQDIKNAFLDSPQNTSATYAGINYELNFVELSHEAYKLKSKIKEILTSAEGKSEISNIYSPQNTYPKWVSTIIEFFNTDKILPSAHTNSAANLIDH